MRFQSPDVMSGSINNVFKLHPWTKDCVIYLPSGITAYQYAVAIF